MATGGPKGLASALGPPVAMYFKSTEITEDLWQIGWAGWHGWLAPGGGGSFVAAAARCPRH